MVAIPALCLPDSCHASRTGGSALYAIQKIHYLPAWGVSLDQVLWVYISIYTHVLGMASMKNFLCYPGKHLLSISVFGVKRLEMTFRQLKNYVRPVWDDKLPEHEEGRETEGEREREREGRGITVTQIFNAST